MTDLSHNARNLNWLVQSFVRDDPGVNDAMVVSADGLAHHEAVAGRGARA